MEESCENLKIYQSAHALGVRIHRMSLDLPSFEKYEEGSQARRSSKRISASIVEGHALRRYKQQYINYLYRALASSDETQEHLKYLRDTGSLTEEKLFAELFDAYRRLSQMIFRYVESVEKLHDTPFYLSEHDAPSVEEPDPVESDPEPNRGKP